MAKPIQELKKPILPYSYTNPDIKLCSCDLPQIEYEYIESAVTGKRYDDIVDMVKQQGCRWSEDGKWVIDEFGDYYTEKKYLEIMEAS